MMAVVDIAMKLLDFPAFSRLPEPPAVYFMTDRTL